MHADKFTVGDVVEAPYKLIAPAAMLDMTIANVALAEISASFDISADAAQWAVLGPG